MIQSYYLTINSTILFSNINQFNFQIGRLLNGTSEVITVAMAPVSANTKVLADLAWFEIV